MINQQIMNNLTPESDPKDEQPNNKDLQGNTDKGRWNPLLHQRIGIRVIDPDKTCQHFTKSPFREPIKEILRFIKG